MLKTTLIATFSMALVFVGVKSHAGHFKDGSIVTLPPLPQTLTWVRQGGDRSRPFVALTDHE
jgi:hypothetical protein